MADARIRIVCGKLGSGKSYLVVSEMLEALCRGEVVVSNIRLKWPGVEAYGRSEGVTYIPPENYRYVDTEELKRRGLDPLVHVLVAGATLVLDELHLVVDARDWESNARTSGRFQDLCTQARKLDLNCFFLSQEAKRIDSRITGQGGEVIRMANWLHFPVLGSWLPFPYLLVRYCDAAGKETLTKRWVRRAARVQKAYDTKQIFVPMALGGAAARSVKGRRKVREFNYGWRLMALGVCVLAFDLWLSRPSKGLLPEVPSAPAPAAAPKKPAAVTMAETSRPSRSSSPPAADSRSASDPELAASVVAAMPPVYAVRPFHLSMMDGGQISVGSALSDGFVIGWEVLPDRATVIVYTDSIKTPSIPLLIHGKRNYVNPSGGPPIRRSPSVPVMGDGSGVRNGSPGDPGGIVKPSASALEKLFQPDSILKHDSAVSR